LNAGKLLYIAPQTIFLTYFLFVVFALLLLWAVPHIPFLRRSGLRKEWLQLIFLLKVIAGLAYGWISLNFFKTSDTWSAFRKALPETEMLQRDPGQFFGTIFRNNYDHGFDRFLSSRDSWWNDLHNTIFIKFIAVLNLLTNNSYYTNVLFFALLSTAGSVALYRMFAQLFPGRPLAIAAGCVLPPSFLLWASGLTRDCLIAVSLYLSFYAFFKILQVGFRARYAAALMAGLMMLLVFRNYMLVLVLVTFLPWLVAARSKWHPLIIFGGFYLVYALLFFQIHHIFPSVDPPQILVDKQRDFYTLIGQSRIETPALEPTFLSFATHSGHALILVFFRPFINETHNLLSALACIEIVCCWGLLVWWMFRYQGSWRPHSAIAACLMFCLAELLVMGFTVNFLGAIVRYRSLLLPLLLTPLLATGGSGNRKPIIL
jgi:hypothetical protein